ncbi:MAG: tryptophan 7-halogenase [Hyphomonadaceae bacterium]|nr:tryptophan 7-halogenase [Hyphomonadaceae bacterium]
MDKPVKDILICGGGLAAWITAAALSRALPDEVSLTVLDIPDTDKFDMLYGTVTAPAAYGFFLEIGLSEPDLLRLTHTAFSFGTHYMQWGSPSRSWVQCHHLPFPARDNVPFVHYFTGRTDARLEDFLVSAQAGLRGVFAHPPEQARIPLSRAEYGYLFSPIELCNALKSVVSSRNITVKAHEIRCVRTNETGIFGIETADEKNLQADLFIDCSGPDAKLLTALNTAFTPEREVRASWQCLPSAPPWPPLRNVHGSDRGWTAGTSVRGQKITFQISDTDSEHHKSGRNILFGKREKAWVGNCVATGHAASVIDPVSPAPMMLLQRDVERLLGLIPLSEDMTVEAREYNRRFESDFEHANLFNQALYAIDDAPDTPFWQQAQSRGDKLRRKISQFENRGIPVAFDMESFNEEDWSILHFGMGRKIKNRNFFAELADTRDIDSNLAKLKQSIAQTVLKMPPHHVYISKLIAYLERKNVGRA